jgi:hypothetical protein
MTKSVYVETSIFSYLTARPSRDIISAAHQQITLNWWENQRQNYTIYASNLVVAEASQGDQSCAQARIQQLLTIPMLEINKACEQLANELIKQSSIPPKAQDDALHVAIASQHNMDFLLTWNCRHLANGNLIPKVRAIIEALGLKFPHICTPEELMEPL